MEVWGRVRWFNTRKGYGFVVGDDGKGDILLHVKQLEAFGFSSVAEGARVRVRVETTERGLQAAEVLDIQPPAPKDPPRGSGPLEPARVKWFDPERGYGFVNVYGRPGDVYLHVTTLQEYGLGAVREGEAIAVRVTTGPKGPTVCEVRDWGYVNRPRGRRRPSDRPVAIPAAASRRASPDALNPEAGAAILEMLQSGPHDGLHRRPRGAPRVRVVRREPEIEALFIRGDHRHVETIVARVFGAE